MDEVDQAIRDTLSFIKENPDCSTSEKNLEANLVKNLFDRELVEGVDTSTIHAAEPEIVSLRLSIWGEELLAELSAPIESENITPAWHTNPLVIGIVALAVGLLIAFFSFRAGW